MSTSFHKQDDSPVTPSSGPPLRAPDLAGKIENADVILVATITRVSDASGPVSLVSTEARPDYDQLREAELAVVRTIAGEPGNGSLKVFFLAGKVPSRPWIALTQGQTVLLFLRSVNGNHVPVVPSEVPLQTLPAIALPPTGVSRTRAVAHELEQIILNADPASDINMIISATMARAELQEDVAVHLLGTPALQNPVRRAAWVAIALSEGKIEALYEVPALFANAAPPSAEALWSMIVQRVSLLRAPTMRPQLAALLQSQNTALARAAAMALRQMHDAAAKPDLVRALDHPDQEVRYQAVMGLAELEPGVEAGPSFELYRRDESQYIQRWKQWWKASRRR